MPEIIIYGVRCTVRRKRDRHTDKQIEREADTQAGRQTYRKTDKQTDRTVLWYFTTGNQTPN